MAKSKIIKELANKKILDYIKVKHFPQNSNY